MDFKIIKKIEMFGRGILSIIAILIILFSAVIVIVSVTTINAINWLGKKIMRCYKLITRRNFKFIWYISLEEIYLQFRRWFYYYFRRKKMMESISKRKGFCDYKNCACCEYFMCKYFDKQTKKCKIWETKPYINCTLSPFDEKDKSRRIKSTCNFYWDKK